MECRVITYRYCMVSFLSGTNSGGLEMGEYMDVEMVKVGRKLGCIEGRGAG